MIDCVDSTYLDLLLHSLIAVQGRGAETVWWLSRTCENLPVRPDLSGTERLAGKVAFYGEYDKSTKHTEQKSPGKGKHGLTDAGKYFGV